MRALPQSVSAKEPSRRSKTATSASAPGLPVCQVRAADDLGRAQGHTADHFRQRHAHVEEFGHRVLHADDRAVDIPHVQVGGQGVGRKTAVEGRHGLAEPEAGGAVPQVEDHSLFAGREEKFVDFALRGKDGKLLRKNMGVDIPPARLTRAGQDRAAPAGAAKNRPSPAGRTAPRLPPPAQPRPRPDEPGSRGVWSSNGPILMPTIVSE